MRKDCHKRSKYEIPVSRKYEAMDMFIFVQK